MTNSHQISPAQLYSIFFVSRILVTLTYIPALNEIALSSDLLVQAFLYPLGMLISALPLYALYQARPDWDIFDCAYRISPVLSKILAVLYALFFLFVALLSVTRFDLFATSRLFPDSDFTIFLLIIILISCAAAGFGLEALGRLSGLAVLLVAVTLGFVIAVLLPRFEPLNFTPLFYDGVMPTLRGTAAFLSGTAEAAALAVIAPRVRGKLTKGYVKWTLWLTLAMALLFFCAISVLGVFFQTQLFPFHSLAVLAEFSVLQRLDAFHTGVWILCLFVKLAFFTLLTVTCLRRAFGRRFKKAWIAGCILVLGTAAVFISGDYERFDTIARPEIMMLLFAVFVILIPLCLLPPVRRQAKLEKEAASV